MKKSFFIAVAVSLMLICAPVVQAGCHYVNGVEGIKAATIPPPGFYYRMYNVYLANDEYKDDHGNESGDFDLDVFCQAHRFIWVADYQLLGADFFADIGIPLVYTNIRMGAGDVTWVDENQFGMGDILLEPLPWHGMARAMMPPLRLVFTCRLAGTTSISRMLLREKITGRV